MTTGVPASPDVGHGPRFADCDNFAFVMNVGHLIDAPSYTLAPGHELRRATTDEVRFIRNMMESLGPAPHFKFVRFWEQPWPYQPGNFEHLPESKWRYFVIAFRGFNPTVPALEEAFDLAPLELEVGFTVLFGKRGGGICPILSLNAGRVFHVLEAAGHNQSFFRDVSASDIGAIQGMYSQLQKHDHRLVDFRRLAAQLGQLKGLPHSSPLRFLGYFALLEALLTHAPQPSDPYDSITRQVKKKLTLLDHRWSPPLDYCPFGGAPVETIWSKMYAYRSLVAHGGKPEFTRELAILKNHDTALLLLKDTVKAVMRQALAEPQLLVDLREC